ncbi:MAG: cysteine hydrolase [Firmicutes bacterium]|jgi:nicotinamidase-related amidase|nr:cysteine hydrolase [Bacillota bacterium]
MKNLALVIVDVQNELIEGHPYNEKNLIENIKKLLLTARKYDRAVIYVRHDGGVGTEFEKETHGWQIYEEIAPIDGEKIVEKEYNSAFHKTNLKEYMDSKNIDSIMLVGMQTEYCIDATCKSAFDLEYEIIMPEGSNTTFDNEYLSGQKLFEYYNYKIWNNRFAKVIPMDEALEYLRKGE